MSSITEIVDEQQVVDGIQDMALQDQLELVPSVLSTRILDDGSASLLKCIKCLLRNITDIKKIQEEINESNFGNHGGSCAICLNEIPLQETAMVKGCEHTYCVTCILRWASCKESPTCPQCKHPFDFLNVHRSLDGSIEDFLFEESVCHLLRASWFIPLDMMEQAAYSYGYHDDFDIPCDYEDDQDDLDEFHYYLHGSSLRLANRRWGDSGFVRSGRQEARPVQKYTGSGSSSSSSSSSVSSSCEPKNKQVKTTSTTGRRAKRAMKREAANKAAEVASAAKHEAHLVRLGRK